MLFFILAIAFIIIGALMVYIEFKIDNVDSTMCCGITGVALCVVTGVCIFGMLLSLPFRGPRFNNIQYEYEITKALIESYEGGEYGNVNSLTDKIITINSQINEHRAKCKNDWLGIWYSEEVGDLEPLRFPERKTQKNN